MQLLQVLLEGLHVGDLVSSVFARQYQPMGSTMGAEQPWPDLRQLLGHSVYSAYKEFKNYYDGRERCASLDIDNHLATCHHCSTVTPKTTDEVWRDLLLFHHLSNSAYNSVRLAILNRHQGKEVTAEFALLVQISTTQYINKENEHL